MCNFCECVFYSKFALKYHMSKIHLMCQVPAYMCEGCFLSFQNPILFEERKKLIEDKILKIRISKAKPRGRKKKCIELRAEINREKEEEEEEEEIEVEAAQEENDRGCTEDGEAVM